MYVGVSVNEIDLLLVETTLTKRVKGSGKPSSNCGEQLVTRGFTSHFGDSRRVWYFVVLRVSVDMD